MKPWTAPAVLVPHALAAIWRAGFLSLTEVFWYIVDRGTLASWSKQGAQSSSPEQYLFAHLASRHRHKDFILSTLASSVQYFAHHADSIIPDDARTLVAQIGGHPGDYGFSRRAEEEQVSRSSRYVGTCGCVICRAFLDSPLDSFLDSLLDALWAGRGIWLAGKGTWEKRRR